VNASTCSQSTLCLQFNCHSICTFACCRDQSSRQHTRQSQLRMTPPTHLGLQMAMWMLSTRRLCLCWVTLRYGLELWSSSCRDSEISLAQWVVCVSIICVCFCNAALSSAEAISCVCIVAKCAAHTTLSYIQTGGCVPCCPEGKLGAYPSMCGGIIFTFCAAHLQGACSNCNRPGLLLSFIPLFARTC